MKTKKASILTKLVVLALLIGVASALLNLRGQIQQAQSDLTQAQAEVAAVENSGDPQRQADIARSKLGLVEPGEYVFYFTN